MSEKLPLETDSLIYVLKSGIMSNLHIIIPSIIVLVIVVYLILKSHCSSNGTYNSTTLQCICNPGYTGLSCETKTPDHVECLKNRGTWENGVCKCRDDYFGKVCSKYCKENETCSGNGTCSTEGTCLCNASFTGSDCKTPVKCPLGSFIKEPCNGYSVGDCVDGRCKCRVKKLVAASAQNCDFHGAAGLRLLFGTFSDLTYFFVKRKCKFSNPLPSEIIKGRIDKTKIMERIFLAVTKLAISNGLHHTFDKEYVESLFTKVCSQDPVEERQHPKKDMNNSKEECLPESRWNDKYKVCCQKGSIPKEENESIDCFWKDDDESPEDEDTV
jgi:hypothetical protein